MSHLQVRQLNLISDYEKGAYFQNVWLLLGKGLFLSKNRKKRRYIFTIPACYMVINSWNMWTTLPEMVMLSIVLSMFLSKYKKQKLNINLLYPMLTGF